MSIKVESVIWNPSYQESIMPFQSDKIHQSRFGMADRKVYPAVTRKGI